MKKELIDIVNNNEKEKLKSLDLYHEIKDMITLKRKMLNITYGLYNSDLKPFIEDINRFEINELTITNQGNFIIALIEELLKEGFKLEGVTKIKYRYDGLRKIVKEKALYFKRKEVKSE